MLTTEKDVPLFGVTPKLEEFVDRLTSLTALVQVVDANGFSAASRRLNMSTTKVSNHIQALEQRLGARLLNRTTRKVSLTEVGETYYHRCVEILAALENADDVAGQMQSTPRGTLRVHTASHLVPFIVSVVAEFLAAYKEVKVDLRAGEASVDLIDDGYDIAIRMTPPPRFEPNCSQSCGLAPSVVLLTWLSRTVWRREKDRGTREPQLRAACELSLRRRLAIR